VIITGPIWVEITDYTQNSFLRFLVVKSAQVTGAQPSGIAE